MTLSQFVNACKLPDLLELDRACHLAFFYLKTDGITEFTANDCAKWIDALNLPKPNATRLHIKLAATRDTIKGKSSSSFRLQHTYVQKMEAAYPHLGEQSQEVVDDGTILPPALYQGTRGYVESLAKQINRSYEMNIFDGCAVLMRRLEEVLLILSYQHLQIDGTIKNPQGNYFMLEGIVSDAVGNQKIKLSRNTKEHVETFRKLGNYSAHSITYTCKKQAIKEKIDDFRYMVEELLHKAGLKT